MTLKKGKLRAQLKRLFLPPETKQFFSNKAQKYVFLNSHKHPTFYVSTSTSQQALPPPPLPEVSGDKSIVTCSMESSPPPTMSDSIPATTASSFTASTESDNSGNVPTAGQISQKLLDSRDSKEGGSKNSLKGLMKRIRKGSFSKKKNGSSDSNTPSEDLSSSEPFNSSDFEEPVKQPKPSSFLNPSEQDLHIEELMYILMDFGILIFFLILFFVVTILVLIRLEEEIDNLDWTGFNDFTSSVTIWNPL